MISAAISHSLSSASRSSQTSRTPSGDRCSFSQKRTAQSVMQAPPADLKNIPRKDIGVKADGALPESVDWRNAGIVTSVKDQGGGQERKECAGNCGSCWTFGSAALVESAWIKAGNKAVNISEQHILDCDTVLNLGCDGGTHIFTLGYLLSLNKAYFSYASTHGLVRMEDYEAYHAARGKCDENAKVYVGSPLSIVSFSSKSRTSISCPWMR